MTEPRLGSNWIWSAAAVALLLVGHESSPSMHRGADALEHRASALARSAVAKAPIEAYRNCLSRPGTVLQVPENLILGIAATENLVRPPLRQQLELWIARTILSARGRLPDLSLGPVQMRPSTAQRFLGPPVAGSGGSAPQDEILRVLTSECGGVGLVNRYLGSLLATRESGSIDRDSVSHLLAEYNGQVHDTWSSRLYNRVVWESYLLLEQRDET